MALNEKYEGYMYICGLGPGTFGNTRQKIHSNHFRKKKGGGIVVARIQRKKKDVFRYCFYYSLFLS